MSFHPARDAIERRPDSSWTVFNHGAATDDLSVVRAQLDGAHEPPPNRRSTVTYVVISGETKIEIDGDAHEARVGDIVMVPPGSRRSFTGQAQLLVICTPKFDPADEQ